MTEVTAEQAAQTHLEDLRTQAKQRRNWAAFFSGGFVLNAAATALCIAADSDTLTPGESTARTALSTAGLVMTSLIGGAAVFNGVNAVQLGQEVAALSAAQAQPQTES